MRAVLDEDVRRRGNVIAARGVALEDAEKYLEPTIRGLMPDPSTLTEMDALADRLAKAITDNEAIALFGDYDVDGACSCALMVRYLRHFGIEPQVHIPDRIYEGYGPNIAAMDKLIDSGASLIITLDCGSTSDAPIAHARGRGADVLVIDHHLSDHELPDANAEALTSAVSENKAEIDNLKSAIESNSAVSGALEAQSVEPADVVAAKVEADGKLTVFVR